MGSMVGKTYLNKMYKIQKECIRYIAKVKKSRTYLLYKRLKILTVHQIIELELINHGYGLDK